MKSTKIENGKELETEEIRNKINVFLIRYFKWLVIFSAFIIIVVGYVFLLKPKYDYVNKLAEDNRFVEEQKYSERQQYLEKMNNLIEVYNKVDSSDIKKVDSILTTRNVPEELFSQMESIVEKNGLLLTFLTIESAEEENRKNSGIAIADNRSAAIALPPEIGRVEATLSVEGIDYFSLKNLLAAMENSLMLMDVTNLDFRLEDGSADLSFYTYFLKK